MKHLNESEERYLFLLARSLSFMICVTQFIR